MPLKQKDRGRPLCARALRVARSPILLSFDRLARKSLYFVDEVSFCIGFSFISPKARYIVCNWADTFWLHFKNYHYYYYYFLLASWWCPYILLFEMTRWLEYSTRSSLLSEAGRHFLDFIQRRIPVFEDSLRSWAALFPWSLHKKRRI